MNTDKHAAFKARRYVQDIVAGLVPTDAQFSAVHDAVADYDLNLMTAENWISLAAKIRELRA